MLVGTGGSRKLFVAHLAIDSLAILAAAVYIIQDRGVVVKEDGSFSTPPAAG